MRFKILICFLWMTAFGWAQKIDNVYFRVDGKQVAVTYDLSGCQKADVALYLSTNGGKTFSSLPLEDVTGDVGKGVLAGRKEIVWNPYGDYPRGFMGEVAFKVKVVSAGSSSEEVGHLAPISPIPYAQMSKRSEGVYPQWLANLHVPECKVGVSPPTADCADARRLALVNVLLKYLYEKGGAIIKSRTQSISESSVGRDGDSISIELMDETFKDVLQAKMQHIRLEILHEFYNYRGEYFIACQFDTPSSQSMELTMDRILKYKMQTKKGKDLPSQQTLQNRCKVVTPWENFILEYEYSQDGTQTESLYRINGGKVYSAPDAFFAYENMTLQQNFVGAVYEEHLALEHSLGLAELDFLTCLPVVPDTIQVKSSMTQHGGDTSKDEIFVQYSGYGCSKPLSVIWGNISDNQLTYTFAREKLIVQSNHKIQSLEGYPVGNFMSCPLNKVVAFYGAIANYEEVPGSGVTTFRSSNEVSDFSSEAFSTSKSLITNFVVDWNKSKDWHKPEPNIECVVDESLREVKVDIYMRNDEKKAVRFKEQMDKWEKEIE